MVVNQHEKVFGWPTFGRGGVTCGYPLYTRCQREKTRNGREWFRFLEGQHAHHECEDCPGG